MSTFTLNYHDLYMHSCHDGRQKCHFMLLPCCYISSAKSTYFTERATVCLHWYGGSGKKVEEMAKKRHAN